MEGRLNTHKLATSAVSTSYAQSFGRPLLISYWNYFKSIMVEITRDLLRKRAEHNEKMLSNLEEISLHQQNIKTIENLDVFCRHLKILYF